MWDDVTGFENNYCIANSNIFAVDLIGEFCCADHYAVNCALPDPRQALDNVSQSQPQVLAAVKRLEVVVGLAVKLLSDLETRLEPVVSDRPTGHAAANGVQESSVRLAAAIDSQSDAVDGLCGRLERVLQNLEL